MSWNWSFLRRLSYRDMFGSMGESLLSSKEQENVKTERTGMEVRL